MKNTFLNTALAVATLTLTHLAQAEVLNCRGIGADSKVTATILSLAQGDLKEGVKQPVAVRIEETIQSDKGYQQQKVIFAGVVKGQTEDVQWFLSSKKLNGTIFLDETNDVTLSVGERSLNLDCQSEVTF